MVSLHAFVLAAALAGSNDLVMLDFGADWCAPCRSMEPTIHRLEENGFPVRRVNMDASPDLARRFNVGPIPCFVMVKNGREVQRIVGATTYDQLVQLYQQAGHVGSQPANSGLRGQSPDRAPLPPPGTAPLGTAPLNMGSSPNPGHALTNSPSGGRMAPNGPPQAPPPTAATTSVQDHQLTDAHRLALQATVRLRVMDETGQSKGTGTIIDVHGNEALVATCGHIFRESQGKGDILVELFAPGSRGPLPGHVLMYECEQRDFALVSIRIDVPVTPVRVATATYHPQESDAIFSVGCNHGADPTVRVSTISAIDRYVGPPNIEILGHPVDGRSGGGLFTSDGRIIGICNAADLQDDRGIYAALPTLHMALDKIGQRSIYMEQNGAPITLANNTNVAPTPPIATPPIATPAIRQTPPSGSHSELICVVRTSDGSARTMVVRNPTAELLQRVSAESQQQALPALQPISRPPGQGIARLSELPSTSPGTVVRAQGY